jgi:lysylphosphatidylglycerol synthetase-like protein (DUF2156 family)
MNCNNYVLEQTIAIGAFVSSTATFSCNERIAYLKQYGTNCNAFASFQSGMDYFDVHDIGYVSFRRIFGLIVVLSDPICNEKNLHTLVSRFMERFPKAVWIQISPALAKYIATKYGYYCSQIGSEKKVQLKDWSLNGKSRQSLRKAVNQARTQGITITEETYMHRRMEQSGELARVSAEWIKTRVVKREVKFLIRPMNMEYHENCRYFYARKDGRVVGFIWFDPIYRDGKVVAYAPNISRAWSGFKRGLWYAMMIHAIEVLKNEGVEYIDLGLFPARVSHEIEAFESTMVHKVMQFIYNKCNWLYSCKGLDFAKSRFDGVFTKTFVAHRSFLPLYSMVAILRDCGVI